MKDLLKKLSSIKIPGSVKDSSNITPEKWNNAMAALESLREIMIGIILGSNKDGKSKKPPSYSVTGRPDFSVANKYALKYKELSETGNYVNKAESGRLEEGDLGDNQYFLGLPNEVFHPESSVFKKGK